MFLHGVKFGQVVKPQFLERGNVFEMFLGVLYRVALLSDFLVVYLGSEFFMFCCTPFASGVIDCSRRISDASRYSVIGMERWQVVVFEPRDVARKP